MTKLLAGLPLLAATMLGACAETSANIAPAYVSPLQFADYSCVQIRDEAQRVANQVSAASGAQDQRAQNDQTAMAVGMILFWPAIFMASGGNEAQAAEVARLKGEMQALEQANIQQGCGIQFRQAPTPA